MRETENVGEKMKQLSHLDEFKGRPRPSGTEVLREDDEHSEERAVYGDPDSALERCGLR